MSLKGIILAGGSGTRLYPATIAISKQLIPVYDKPMIYYPLSVLMLAGIKDILIISTKRDIHLYEELFKDGSKFGLNISYAIQSVPRGIAEAFIIGESFIANDSVCLILGDNIIYGENFTQTLQNIAKINKYATIFGYYVNNPSEYGVVEIDELNNPISIEEKPQKPKSNYAVPGLYFYNNEVVDIAKTISPSDRGELEITSVNNIYILNRKLKVELLGRGMAWLDAGTHDSLLVASNYIATIQKRQGLYIACIEEIAYHMKFINADMLIKLASSMNNTDYSKYLYKIIEERG